MKKQTKRDIFLSAGHSNVKGKDRGAAGNGYVEGDLTVEFRDLVFNFLTDEFGYCNVVTDDNRNFTSQTIRLFRNKTKSNSIVVDFHWNAATPAATGTEVLVPHDSTALENSLALSIAKSIGSILSIPLRGNHRGNKGVKSEMESHHGRLGWMRLTGENVLPEICFITNKSDMEKYQENKVELARAVAKDILSAATTPVASNSPTKDTMHTVSGGDTLGALANRYNTTVANIKMLNSLTTDMIYVNQVLRIK